MMSRSVLYTLLLAAVLVWCLLILVPPVCLELGPSYAPIAGAIYAMFSPICHQVDSRSLHLEGHKLAVCSRCSSIYFGFLFGMILGRFLLHKTFLRTRAWWVIAVLPMVLDVVLDALGVSSSNFVTRIFTGSLFGVIAARVLAPVIIEAVEELIRHKSLGINYESKA